MLRVRSEGGQAVVFQEATVTDADVLMASVFLRSSASIPESEWRDDMGDALFYLCERHMHGVVGDPDPGLAARMAVGSGSQSFKAADRVVVGHGGFQGGADWFQSNPEDGEDWLMVGRCKAAALARAVTDHAAATTLSSKDARDGGGSEDGDGSGGDSVDGSGSGSGNGAGGGGSADEGGQGGERGGDGGDGTSCDGSGRGGSGGAASNGIASREGAGSGGSQAGNNSATNCNVGVGDNAGDDGGGGGGGNSTAANCARDGSEGGDGGAGGDKDGNGDNGSPASVGGDGSGGYNSSGDGDAGDAWFIFTAACDTSGFMCRGWLKCVVASGLERFVEHALGDKERRDLAQRARGDPRLVRACVVIQAHFRGWACRMRTAFNPHSPVGNLLIRRRFTALSVCVNSDLL